MGFFSRFSKKVEVINKGESPLESILDEMYIDEVETIQEEAMDQWIKMAQNIIVNAVKATNNSVERAFALIDFDESAPSFNLFYQEKEKIIYWKELEDKEHQDKIEKQLLPQAKEVTQYINDLFSQAELQKIRYAELQYENSTSAWFSHIIWSDSEEGKLSKEKIETKWYELICTNASSRSTDSNKKFPWYP